MAEQFRQIKRSLAEQFRQKKRSLAEQLRQIKCSLAEPHAEICFWFGKGDIPNENFWLPPPLTCFFSIETPLFRLTTFYLAELFRQATFYLAELFHQATFYLAELFRQIAFSLFFKKKNLDF